MKIDINKIGIIALSVIVSGVMSVQYSYSAPSSVMNKEPVNNSVVKNKNVIQVSPIEVVNNPQDYLNKIISFNAEFIAFSSLGLDYKPAYKPAEKYIGILIKREDVPNHTIPLSEMKLFITRETAEKNIDLEQGDKVRITGKVFSAALGDPWVDITTFEVTDKKPKKKE